MFRNMDTVIRHSRDLDQKVHDLTEENERLKSDLNVFEDFSFCKRKELEDVELMFYEWTKKHEAEAEMARMEIERLQKELEAERGSKKRTLKETGTQTEKLNDIKLTSPLKRDCDDSDQGLAHIPTQSETKKRKVDEDTETDLDEISRLVSAALDAEYREKQKRLQSNEQRGRTSNRSDDSRLISSSPSTDKNQPSNGKRRRS
ncbi:hypothetical protein ACOME3_003656 [Neoechinorhynchus agilis]